ncbi:MAG: PspC domain-containing protein [Tannerellaceae bacterium]|jgi:phage shock protein PspC (stress-responsive transcriptional regulator)|nr:PspC domain-containing protein [Tannerellaceae bacterium]
MKKTLTVNLGGTVFHIDEDAYQLLEKYLSNLRIHFSKEEGVDEVINDFELRISEILNERIRLGYEVISIEHVEAVIKRMGKIEDIFGEESARSEPADEESFTQQTTRERVEKRFFRNPNDRILGGVCGGIAAYMGWDPTPIRLLLFLFMFLYGVIIPVYLILWLVVPMAKTATERLQMRGESITVENIGKTVTDGFERVSSNVRDYVNSGKPRSTFQKIGDGIVDIIGVLLKVAVILLGIVLLPVFLVLLFVFVVVIIALIAGSVGGGFGLLYSLIPSTEWHLLHTYPEWMWIIVSICTILLIAIPVIAILYSICSVIFKFKPLPQVWRISMIVIWILALAANIFIFSRYGLSALEWGHDAWNSTLWRTYL